MKNSKKKLILLSSLFIIIVVWNLIYQWRWLIDLNCTYSIYVSTLFLPFAYFILSNILKDQERKTNIIILIILFLILTFIYMISLYLKNAYNNLYLFSDYLVGVFKIVPFLLTATMLSLGFNFMNKKMKNIMLKIIFGAIFYILCLNLGTLTLNIKSIHNEKSCYKAFDCKCEGTICNCKYLCNNGKVDYIKCPAD